MIAPSGVPPRWYWSAIWRATVTTCTFALPLGLLQKYLLESNQIEPADPANLLMYLGILFCAALGGYAAAKLAPTSPLHNGAAAAGLSALVIQVGGVARRLLTGQSISNPISWVFLALLMATCGMFGAYVHRATHGSLDPNRSADNSSGSSGAT